MRRYAIREIFDSFQGEGARTGERSVFVRFAGCNLWSGDRASRQGAGACARWCDTDFAEAREGKLTAEQIVARIDALWSPEHAERWVVLTGGEPLLQLDDALLGALKGAGISVAVETNGTIAFEQEDHVDWLVVSPKLSAKGEVPTLKVTRPHEVKLVLGPIVAGDLVLPLAIGPQWTDAQIDALASQIESVDARWYAQPLAIEGSDDEFVAHFKPSVLRRLAAERAIDVARRRGMGLSFQGHKLHGLR